MSREQLLNEVQRRKGVAMILDSKIPHHRYLEAAIEIEARLAKIQIPAVLESIQISKRGSAGYALKKEDRPSSPPTSEKAPSRLELRLLFTKLHDVEALVDDMQRQIPSRHRQIRIRMGEISKRVADCHRKLRQLERLLPEISPFGNRLRGKRRLPPRKAKIEDFCKGCRSSINRDPDLRKFFKKEGKGKVPQRNKVEDMLNVKKEEEMDYSWQHVLTSTEEIDALQRWETPSPEFKTEDYAGGVQKCQDENELGLFSSARLGATYREAFSPKIKIKEPCDEARETLDRNMRTLSPELEFGTTCREPCSPNIKIEEGSNEAVWDENQKNTFGDVAVGMRHSDASLPKVNKPEDLSKEEQQLLEDFTKLKVARGTLRLYSLNREIDLAWIQREHDEEREEDGRSKLA